MPTHGCKMSDSRTEPALNIAHPQLSNFYAPDKCCLGVIHGLLIQDTDAVGCPKVKQLDTISRTVYNVPPVPSRVCKPSLRYNSTFYINSLLVHLQYQACCQNFPSLRTSKKQSVMNSISQIK